MEVIIVNERAIEYIKKGEKRIEVRKDSSFFSNFEPGKIFYFLELKTLQKILVRTTRINSYKSISDLLFSENINIINPYPCFSSVDDSLSLYKKHYKNKISGDWISIYFDLI